MARAEFTKTTMREALARSGKLCEAVGAMYNLPAGQRCNAPLGVGIEYDHVIMEANSHDNSLSNCACVCIPCHRWKTAKHDIPMAAKTVRMQDKNNNITRPKQSIPSPLKPAKPPAKPTLPRRALYQPEPRQ